MKKTTLYSYPGYEIEYKEETFIIADSGPGARLGKRWFIKSDLFSDREQDIQFVTRRQAIEYCKHIIDKKKESLMEQTDKKKKLLEECFAKAEKTVLKEYTIAQKSKLISLITFLTQWNNSELNKSPDKEFANELEKITSFYRYFDGSFYEVEDDSVYDEFKSKLIELANKFRVALPENLK